MPPSGPLTILYAKQLFTSANSSGPNFWVPLHFIKNRDDGTIFFYIFLERRPFNDNPRYQSIRSVIFWFFSSIENHRNKKFDSNLNWQVLSPQISSSHWISQDSLSIISRVGSIIFFKDFPPFCWPLRPLRYSPHIVHLLWPHNCEGVRARQRNRYPWVRLEGQFCIAVGAFEVEAKDLNAQVW